MFRGFGGGGLKIGSLWQKGRHMTTTMVSLEGLRDLAAFRAQHGCAISLYLDLHPSVTPTAGDTATRVELPARPGGEVARCDARRPRP